MSKVNTAIAFGYDSGLEDGRRQGAEEMREAVLRSLRAHHEWSAHEVIAALPLPGDKEANDDA